MLEVACNVTYTNNDSLLRNADYVIVAVPTPVDKANIPDFTPLIQATNTIGLNLKKNALIIYESTVYPGATEEICIKQIEKISGLKWKHDFHIGYSPERINPGDKIHTLSNVIKIVSGDDEETLEMVANLYEKIVDAGVYRAESIKVAEAAKVIENTQRDINIALMNELAIIFNKLDINTKAVLNAAGTKWNFLKFEPGLVGGHCIGVDPYYLTYQAQRFGYHPEMILAGRRINDGMGRYIASEAVKIASNNNKMNQDLVINIFGVTFKENCSDIRNSKVIDIVKELQEYGISVNIHDPCARPQELESHYGVSTLPYEKLKKSAISIVAVAHSEYKDISRIIKKTDEDGVIIDVKSIYKVGQFNSIYQL